MIKKLQRKFIAVAMISVILVLISIMGVINITTYLNITKKADALLYVLTESGGAFPNINRIQNVPDIQPKPVYDNISAEAPYETRYFSVYFKANGEVIKADTSNIAAISNDQAIEYAKDIYSSNKQSGSYGQYMYSSVAYEDGQLIVFIDCSRDLSIFSSFLMTSILVSVSGILSVFILVCIFSKIIVKPVAESYEKQKCFITDASHEIKTPLTIIDANTEVLEMENGENEWTKSIKNQIKRLTSLTNSLVSLTKMDEENNKIQMTDFSLSDAVTEASSSFIVLAQTHGNTFETNIEKNISFNGDEKAIRQLVSILLDNAIKYSDNKGIIEVSLKKQNKKIELTVFNTVEHIEKGNHDIMFDRFYRADSSRNSQTGGYGIGLSLAKSIVESHRAKIFAKSTNEKSIEFTVLF